MNEIKHGTTGKRGWYLVKGKKFFYELGDEESRVNALRKARKRQKEKPIILLSR